MENSIPEKILNDGLKIPSIGFGTFGLNGEGAVESVKNAIDLGYRLIDGAFNYENEGAVGKGVRESSVSRDKLFVTSKLPGRHHAYKEALQTIQESLYRAGLDYYDLYLIHWPNPKVNLYVEAWQALIESKKRGLIRSIGVCNFLPEHLERLEKEAGVLPSVNQIELHPYFNQKDAREWNAEHGIITEAWSPIGRGSDIRENSTIKEIAKVHNKSVSQVILRWHIQLGNLPIPKANSKEHQLENLEIFNFSLNEEQMTAINNLTKENGRLKNQDPSFYQEF